MRGRWGMIVLAIWLILWGLVDLGGLALPAGATLLAILAIVAGILIFLDIRGAASSNIGRLLLAIWLILWGILPLLNISFPASATVLAILALAAGVLLLLGR